MMKGVYVCMYILSTQMYGHYSELQRFAREFAASQRTRPQQPPGIEEALKKTKKTYSTFNQATPQTTPL